MLKVGVQSASWYNKNKPLESFEYIKSCGFETVDFNVDLELYAPTLARDGITPSHFDLPLAEFLEYYRPFKEASEATGLTIGQMHAPFPVWFKDKDDVNEYLFMALDKCFALCEYLSCPAVVVHPVLCPSFEEEWELNLALYRKLIPVVKKYNNVTICIENIYGRQKGTIIEGRLSNASDLAKMIDVLNEEAGGRYFACCFDIGHANLTRRNVKDFVKILGDRLMILHLHDNNGNEDNHMIPYSYLKTESDYVCNWPAFIEGLKEIGYKGNLAFEICRLYFAYPKPVHTEALKLVSAIGHYWVDLLKGE